MFFEIIKNILLKIKSYISPGYVKIIYFACCSLLVLLTISTEVKRGWVILEHWQKQLMTYFAEKETHVYVVFVTVLVLQTGVIISIYLLNRRALIFYKDLSEMEIKKRYFDMWDMRLLRAVERVGQTDSYDPETSLPVALKSYILAHTEMTEAIEMFRKDDSKLLTAQKLGLSLPPENTYAVYAAAADKRAKRAVIQHLLTVERSPR